MFMYGFENCMFLFVLLKPCSNLLYLHQVIQLKLLPARMPTALFLLAYAHVRVQLQRLLELLEALYAFVAPWSVLPN